LLEFDDSDVFFGNSLHLYPFEVMYRQSTAAIILNALDPSGKLAGYFQRISTLRDKSAMDLSGLTGSKVDFVKAHIISTQFILDHITEVPAIAGPKFTYIHLFIPHYPYVFGPEGEIMTDPGFYDGDRGSALDTIHEEEGYVNQVQYINKLMIPILQTIISESENPPILLLMGDHGLVDTNRRTILMAYYLPDNGNEELYSTISPVNSFRLIFNKYFGGDYPLLPDLTYIDDTTTAPDAYPNCAP
jgi:hypothetical protein